MSSPQYLNLKEAQNILAIIGIEFSERQIKRSAELNAHGLRKLPYFIDPIDGRLKIEKNILLEIYAKAQTEAKDTAINKLEL